MRMSRERIFHLTDLIVKELDATEVWRKILTTSGLPSEPKTIRSTMARSKASFPKVNMGAAR